MSLCLLVGGMHIILAQGPEDKDEAVETSDSLRKKPTMRIKVDGVTSVVGDYVILESDIDKTLIDLEAQGANVKNITRCELLGKLMEDKLYAHHAVLDSLPVSDAEINSYVDNVVDYFVQQMGTIDKVLDFYGKDDEESFRKEIFEVRKTQKLAADMQAKIVEDVEITPEEVRQFFNRIPEEDRPQFGAELEIAQIVVKPKVPKVEEQKVIDKLNEIRRDVLDNGISFTTKAILYSQDPGSRSSGGKYTLYRKRPQMVKEFRDVAFSLQEGEVSEPFKTDFGWHILTVEKIRGQVIDVRHILLIPEVPQSALNEARAEIDTIRKRIIDKELTYEEAAKAFSDEKETRNNGGVLIKPQTYDTHFELTKMDPTMYSQIVNLKDNEITQPLLEEDSREGKKYKVMMVTNRYDEHIADFSKDYIKIKNLALKEKQLKSIQKWMSEKIADTYVSVNADYRDCNFANNWLKK